MGSTSRRYLGNPAISGSPIATPVDVSVSNVVEFPGIKKFINKVHVGDAVQVMRSMPETSVDIVVTSPPYNLRNSTGNGMRDGRGGKWENARLINGYSTHDDNMPYPEYILWQRR